MRAEAWNFLLAFLLAHFMCSYAFVPPMRIGVGKLTRGFISSRRTGPSKIVCQAEDRKFPAEDVPRKDKRAMLRCPGTSLLGWREYRARLVKSETPFWMRPSSRSSDVSSVFEIPRIEAGCLLIDTTSLQGKSLEQGGISGHRDVIFVLSNDESGTRGLVLNRPSDCVIGDLTDLMGSFSGNNIYCGGMDKWSMDRLVKKRDPKMYRELRVLHPFAKLKGSQEVIEGIYAGANLKDSMKQADARNSSKNFRFFYSCVSWGPGQLERLHREGAYVAASASRSDMMCIVLQDHTEQRSPFVAQKPLWRLLLEAMGGRNSLIARQMNGEL